MSELTDYIKATNASTLAWVAEDPENRCAGLLDESLEYWEQQGIFTVSDFERDSLIESIWDAYKECNGIRPRGMDFDSMNMEELQSIMDGLNDSIRIEREEAIKAQEGACRK